MNEILYFSFILSPKEPTMKSRRENEQEKRKKILLLPIGATTFLISEYFGMSMKYVG